MLPGFQQSLFPGDHVVLGLRMERMTLGHLRLLTQCRGHWLAEVYACAQPWRQSDRDVDRWWFWVWWKLWMRRVAKADMEAEQRKWRAYITEQWAAPMAKTPLRPGQIHQRQRTLGSPDVYLLEAAARAELGMRDECLDRPVNELLALISAHREIKGEVELWSEQDEMAWQFSRKLSSAQRN